jgi:hypothetical protein
VPLHVAGPFYDIEGFRSGRDTIRAFLRVEFPREHDATLFERFETLERGPDGMFRVPAGRPRIPLMYSLRARKP